MIGEADVATLLAGLRPRLSDTEFAFGVVPSGGRSARSACALGHLPGG